MKPVVLCILDGWGEKTGTTYDAITLAKTPNFDRIEKSGLRASLKTSGLSVGLPEGQMGNSEVGHMNIGGGRVVMQTLPKIDIEIENGSLAKTEVLQEQIKLLQGNGRAVHLLGLISDGGVHAHMGHVIALAKIYDAAGIKTYIHAFTDGRDTPPDSAKKYVSELLEAIKPLKNVSLATLSGRYYAMDRDKRWDRVQLAYDVIISGNQSGAGKFTDAITAIDESYKAGKLDEFLIPVTNADYPGANDGDAFLFANFRSDRARQISLALAQPSFNGFERKKLVKFSSKIGMVEYSEEISQFLQTIIPSDNLVKTLGEVVSAAGLKQLRIAETEKYAHVTFFFNGGIESVFKDEDRILIPSPNVATYDLKPEMSSVELTEKLVPAIESGQYSLIVVNFANPDMVGHTGVIPAAVKAVEAVDLGLGKIEQAVTKVGGVLITTADHGNVEQMVDPETGEPHTAHTTGPVPIIVSNYKSGAKLNSGRLADIAPTILHVLGIPQPKEMDGVRLLED